MKKREPVSTIMTREVVTVQAGDSLHRVIDLLKKHHIRHIPVISEKHLVGIISRTDINRLAFSNLFAGEEHADEAVLDMLNLPQVMSHKPRVVRESDTIRSVAQILSKEEFHALPVVQEGDEAKLVGIVTTTDVIRYLLDQYE